MPRAAADNPNYTFVLRNDNNGRYLKDVVIELPSASTIIKRTLATPHLAAWRERATKDLVVGLVDQLVELGTDPHDIVDMLRDADWLDEMLKENKLRPSDITSEASTRGTREHKTLEDLATLALKDSQEAYIRAQKYTDSENGWERAIGTWWVDEFPEVIASERILPCPRYGFCGTTDLVWYDSDSKRVITDLKTRQAGRDIYESDEIQVEGYWTAHDLLYPNTPAERGTVLLALEDGTYKHEDINVRRGMFMAVKSVDDEIQRRRHGLL